MYWNTALPICLHFVYGCFGPTTGELSNCNTGCMGCKAEKKEIKKRRGGVDFWSYGGVEAALEISFGILQQHQFLLIHFPDWRQSCPFLSLITSIKRQTSLPQKISTVWCQVCQAGGHSLISNISTGLRTPASTTWWGVWQTKWVRYAKYKTVLVAGSGCTLNGNNALHTKILYNFRMK